MAQTVPDSALRHNGPDAAGDAPSALCPKPYAEVIGLAAGAGLVSVHRAAALPDLTVGDLRDLFAVHNVAQPVGP